MKNFSSATGFLFAILIMLSLAVTYKVSNQPLSLEVVSAKPNLVEIRANTPIKQAQLEQEDLKATAYGDKLYLESEEDFVPGETYEVQFQEIINQFGETNTEASVTFTLPDTLQYFITNTAELGVYNLQQNTQKILTPSGFIVNEYVVAGNDVYLLGITEEQNQGEIWERTRLQEFYKWDGKNQKLTKVLSSQEWVMQGLGSSPDGQVLTLYKAPNEDLIIPNLWLYDTTTETWQKYWNESFGAGSHINLSPDNAWLLGADLTTNGYILSPVLEGPEIKPIGNYFNNIGISPTGKYMLFKAYKDDNIFNNEPIFVLFSNTGDSQEIFTDASVLPDLITFDPEEDRIWYTFIDDLGITGIGSYDIETAQTQTFESLSEDSAIISIDKAPHNDVLLYGVKEQSIQVSDTQDIQNLLDSYFSEENTPVFRIKSYNLKTEESKVLFDGLILKK